MLKKVLSAANLGLETQEIDVEVSVAQRGLPGFDIVGLPDKVVAESRERVKSAIVNSGIDFPNRKITVNLAPADLPKEGVSFDMPIALGIVACQKNIFLPKNSLFFGELSLDGSLRHTRGGFLFALLAREKGLKNIFLPAESAAEAAAVDGVKVYPLKNLSQLIGYFSGRETVKELKGAFVQKSEIAPEFDMAEILGQEQAKRAMEIAAAGSHNIMLTGSPGAGKTMLARALPGILPSLSEEESMEVTKIYSCGGAIQPGGSLISSPPFRNPHHTASAAGLIGGGSKPEPGEISLAHRGVLFLDEFNEFSRSLLEALRQPMEDGFLTIARSRSRVRFPARFMLVASCNPCPCGYFNHPQKRCVCSSRTIEKYRKRISGPILDRIDLQVEVPPAQIAAFSDNQRSSDIAESSKTIKQRVSEAKKIQRARFARANIFSNAEMKNRDVKKYCPLGKAEEMTLRQAALKFQLSARAYLKIIKVARTIADLAGNEKIEIEHLAEAMQYRFKNHDNF